MAWHARDPRGAALPDGGGGGGPALQAARPGLGAGLPGRRRARSAPRARLVTDVESVLHFAELGVVLLLFLIGLELQPPRLWELRTPRLRAAAARRSALTGAVLAGRRAGARALLAGGARRRARALAAPRRPSRCSCSAEKNELRPRHGRDRLRHPPLPGPGGDPAARAAARARRPRAARATRAWVPLAKARRGSSVCSSAWSGRPLRAAARLPAGRLGAQPGGLHRPALLLVVGTALSGQRRSGSRWRWGRSSPACCSRTRSTATSSRRTSSRSRGCCWGCSSSRWACR